MIKTNENKISLYESRLLNRISTIDMTHSLSASNPQVGGPVWQGDYNPVFQSSHNYFNDHIPPIDYQTIKKYRTPSPFKYERYGSKDYSKYYERDCGTNDVKVINLLKRDSVGSLKMLKEGARLKFEGEKYDILVYRRRDRYGQSQYVLSWQALVITKDNKYVAHFNKLTEKGAFLKAFRLVTRKLKDTRKVVEE